MANMYHNSYSLKQLYRFYSCCMALSYCQMKMLSMREVQGVVQNCHNEAHYYVQLIYANEIFSEGTMYSRTRSQEAWPWALSTGTEPWAWVLNHCLPHVFCSQWWLFVVLLMTVCKYGQLGTFSPDPHCTPTFAQQTLAAHAGISLSTS